MRRVWAKLSGETPNLDDSFNVIEQQWVSQKQRTQSETNPESGLINARGNPTGALNTMDSGTAAPGTKTGSKLESPGTSTDVGHKDDTDEAHSHIEGGTS